MSFNLGFKKTTTKVEENQYSFPVLTTVEDSSKMQLNNAALEALEALNSKEEQQKLFIANQQVDDYSWDWFIVNVTNKGMDNVSGVCNLQKGTGNTFTSLKIKNKIVDLFGKTGSIQCVKQDLEDIENNITYPAIKIVGLLPETIVANEEFVEEFMEPLEEDFVGTNEEEVEESTEVSWVE